MICSFLTVLEAGKSKIKALVGLVSPESQVSTFKTVPCMPLPPEAMNTVSAHGEGSERQESSQFLLALL
jgi:hypothetical protein